MSKGEAASLPGWLSRGLGCCLVDWPAVSLIDLLSHQLACCLINWLAVSSIGPVSHGLVPAVSDQLHLIELFKEIGGMWDLQRRLGDSVRLGG